MYSVLLFQEEHDRIINLKLQIKDTQTRVQELQLADELPAINIEDLVVLDVSWLDFAQVVQISDLDLEIPESNQELSAYKVGIVQGGEFDGDDLYIIEERVLYAKRHYRVIDDRDDTGLVLLSNISNEVASEGSENYILSNAYIIPDLIFPQSISIAQSEGQLEFEVEVFSPAALFDEFIDDANAIIREDLVHDEYGALYESVDGGYFVVKAYDHTVKIYRLAFPFEEFEFSLDTEMGDRIDGVYSPEQPSVCPPILYDVHIGIDSRLSTISLIDEVALYEPIDQVDSLVRDVYEVQDQVSDYKAFLQDHPVLLFKDQLDRWVRMRNIEYYHNSETECGYTNSAI